ncbi:MAG: hypothetical protein WCI71_18335 [Bacteroidota bacterium]
MRLTGNSASLVTMDNLTIVSGAVITITIGDALTVSGILTNNNVTSGLV